MSLYFTVLASNFSTGVYSVLEGLKSFKVTATLDSPAESFSAVFAPKSRFAELEYIQVYEKGNLLFSGKVDSQKTCLAKSGLTVEIDARSPGALLLDNQSMPGIIIGANIEAVYNYFITPHGFTFYNPNHRASIALFTVRMGMSEWDVLKDFARRAYGFIPYVVDKQVMLERRQGLEPVHISNKSGIPYASITHTRTPYSVISRIFYRSDDGAYRYYLNNVYPAAKRITRQRFFIPASEYADIPSADATARINRSMLDYEQIAVELPGAVKAELGQDAVIADDVPGKGGHMVGKIEYMADETGVITRLTLVNPAYYDRERK